MYVTTLLSIVAAIVLAAPVSNNGPEWIPAEGTTMTCDASSNKYILASKASTLIEKACVAAMDKCAFPQRVGSETVCAAVLDWPLHGAKTVPLNETVMNATGGEESNVHPVFTVTPAVTAPSPDSDLSMDVSWTAGDCLGYFGQLLLQNAPSGCMTSAGAGAGSLTVGGKSSLKDTVFAVSFSGLN